MRNAALVLLASLAQAASVRLLPLGHLKYSAERLGSVTVLHCQPEGSPDCALLERLELTPDADWQRLLEAAVKRERSAKPAKILAKATVVDQHGGPWLLAIAAKGVGREAAFLKGRTYLIVPDFPGYRLTMDADAVSSVEVLRTKAEWSDAATERKGEEER